MMEKRCEYCNRHPELHAHRTPSGPPLKGAICFFTFSYLWERDLLELAKESPAFCELAIKLGFTVEKIQAKWPHPDEGRFVCLGRLTKEEIAALWGPFAQAALS